VYTQLGEERLPGGERLTIGVVLGPDREWLPRIAPFLGHKNLDYRAHIQRALEGPLDGLETRFYVGTLGGELVTQGMVVGARGTGILGHVFTHPEHRRKGAYSRLMHQQMEDCRRAGFRALCLATTPETHPYRIYQSFGFRPIAADSGRMKWLSQPDAEDGLFAIGKALVRDLRWDDWGYLDLLAFQPVQPDEELPRAFALNLKGQDSVEGPFVPFQLLRERDARLQARVLESESGATAGWALLAPDRRWFRDSWVLDLHTHPRFAGALSDLLAALSWPEEPVAAYLTLPEGPKAAVLAAAGFRRVTTLPGWLLDQGERRDLGVWLRQ
jgi:GNAT superfamily N-acetyltransferase